MREFFNCECRTEGLILDSQDDEFPYAVYLAIWQYGSKGNQVDFWTRIKWAFSILKRGLMWNDEIILHPATAEKVGLALIKRAKIAKKIYAKYNLLKKRGQK